MTKFNCSGIQDINQSFWPLPTKVTTPDGGTYTIQYEVTPGNSNARTGRISQLNLPSGGYILYAYSDTTGHNGINCTTEVVPTLTRKVYDNYSKTTSTWTYVNSGATVVETDPALNQTVHYFAGEFQTLVQFYSGGCPTTISGCTGGGTELRFVTTCYNPNANFSNCASAPILPITQTDVYTWMQATPQNLVETKYDQTYGVITSVGRWDWGAALPPTSSFLVSTTYAPRGTWNGSGCTPTIGSYINDRVCYKNVNDGSGNLQSSETFSYNPQGHLVTHVVGTTTSGISGPTLTSRFTYTNGIMTTAKDANGAVTQFSNFTCNGMLPQTTTLPQISGESFQMSTSQSWDCNGGVLTSSTDANGNQTTYKYVNPQTNVADPLWRLVYTKRPEGGNSTVTYNTGSSLPWSIATNTVIDSGGHNYTVTNTLDGLGRTVQTTRSTDGSTVSTVFNVLGQVYTVSAPYFGTPNGVTTYLYDALGRVLSQTDPANNAVNYSYTGRATEVQYYPSSINKQVITQIDGLGRTTTVCEVGSTQINNNPGRCNLDISASGFITSYLYDALGDLTMVTQAGLNSNRKYNYDAISRLTSESNPESGSVSYTYDTGQAGDLYQRVRNGVTTTYTHDPLHRLTQTAYSDATIWSARAYDGYDIFTGSYDLGDGKGLLTSAWTCCANSQNQTADSYSYDLMGRVLTDKQQTPSGAVYQFPYTYNYIGNVLTQSNAVSNYTNTYNAIGQLTNVNASYLSSTQSGTLATGFTYNAFGEVTSDTLGNNLTETFKYDQTGRPNWYNLGGGIYQYGTDSSYPVSWGGNYLVSSGDNVNGNWINGYDSFGRLFTANCAGNAYCPAANGGSVNYTYAYDRYGNRWQQNFTSGTGITKLLTFNTNNQVASNTYDALGNTLNDGTNTYTYDAENRLITVSGGTSYAYDAFGRRVYRQITAGTREYTYDLQGNVLTRTVSGSIGPAFISVAGRHWGEIPTSGGDTLFMHSDWLGSARAYTRLDGSLHSTCQTLPFGDARSCTASNDDDYFAGPLWWSGDDSSYLSETRHYNPAQAHWATTDPAGLAATSAGDPQTWNRYAYSSNNPVSFTDPTGLQQCSDSASPAICQPGTLGANLLWNFGTWDEFETVGWSYTGEDGFTSLNAPVAIQSTNCTPGAQGCFNVAANNNPIPCRNGWGSGGAAVGGGYNLDLGAGLAGASSTGSVDFGLFHNSAGGVASGYSGGAFASGAATAYAGSHVVGAPTQTSSTVFSLGAYAGAGANVLLTNGASSQQVSGPFTTVSINVGIGVANLGVQVSFGSGIWEVSVTPPVVSVGIGAAGSVVTTNTKATRTGCGG
jgi:RHS repeat-associated protein